LYKYNIMYNAMVHYIKRKERKMIKDIKKPITDETSEKISDPVEILKSMGITDYEEVTEHYVRLNIGEYISGIYQGTDETNKIKYAIIKTDDGNKRLRLSVILEKELNKINPGDNIVIYRIEDGKTRLGIYYKKYRIFKINKEV
ncbi:MAG: hypothetical protein ACUVQP_06845, partial [Bacteroidales bacterium]